MNDETTTLLADAVKIAKAVTDSLSRGSLIETTIVLSEAVLVLNAALSDQQRRAEAAEAMVAETETELRELRHAHESAPRGGPETPGSLA